MAKKKRNFYHIRWNRCGLNEARAADVLGISVEDVQRFDIEGAPLMAERLLCLWDCKSVGIPGWDGFMFSRGVLRFKNRRYTPSMLKAYRDQQERLDDALARLSWLSTWRGLFTAFVHKAVDSIKPVKAFRGLRLD